MASKDRLADGGRMRNVEMERSARMETKSEWEMKWRDGPIEEDRDNDEDGDWREYVNAFFNPADNVDSKWH
jgi:hypothetical protein